MTSLFRWRVARSTCLVVMLAVVPRLGAVDPKPGDAVVIELNDGTTREGKLKSLSQDEVTVEVGAGMSEIVSRSDIKTMKGPGAAATTVTPPAAAKPAPAAASSAAGTATPSTPSPPAAVAAPPPQSATTPAGAVDWNSLPQSGKITISAKGRPAKEVIAEIGKQAGFGLDWEGDAKATLDLGMEQTGFMETLGSICKERAWGMQEYQTADGNVFKIPESFPVRQYQAKGPFLLLWHDFATVTNVFKDVSSKYRLKLVTDPNSHVRTSFEKSLREEPVTFVLEGGKKLTLQSDHSRTTFTSGDATWMFDAGKGLTGTNVAIEVDVPACVPSRINQCVLPWKFPTSGGGGAVDVTLANVKMEKKQESVSDIHSKDFMKKYDVHEFTANFTVAHAGAAVFQKLRKENRQPTPEEQEKIAGFPVAGVVAPHEAVLIGGDGTRIVGVLKSPEGMSVQSPYDGYGKRAVFKVKDPAFVPKEISIAWAEEFRTVIVHFKMENVPIAGK